MYTWTLSP